MTKIKQAKLKKYEQEIDRLMKKHQEQLTPQQIVDNARSETSPLHDYFTWNDTEEAHLWRLHKARLLFGCVIKEIRVKGESQPKEFRKYINVKTVQQESVYVPTEVAVKTTSYRQQIIDECIKTSETLTDKLKVFKYHT